MSPPAAVRCACWKVPHRVATGNSSAVATNVRPPSAAAPRAPSAVERRGPAAQQDDGQDPHEARPGRHPAGWCRQLVPSPGRVPRRCPRSPGRASRQRRCVVDGEDLLVAQQEHVVQRPGPSRTRRRSAAGGPARARRAISPPTTTGQSSCQRAKTSTGITWRELRGMASTRNVMPSQIDLLTGEVWSRRPARRSARPGEPSPRLLARHPTGQHRRPGRRPGAQEHPGHEQRARRAQDREGDGRVGGRGRHEPGSQHGGQEAGARDAAARRRSSSPLRRAASRATPR